MTRRIVAALAGDHEPVRLDIKSACRRILQGRELQGKESRVTQLQARNGRTTWEAAAQRPALRCPRPLGGPGVLFAQRSWFFNNSYVFRVVAPSADQPGTTAAILIDFTFTNSFRPSGPCSRP